MKALFLAAFAALFVMPAWAQSIFCGRLDDAHASLAGNHGESVIGSGLAGAEMVVVYANEETGSFSVLVVGPDGTACLPVSGHSWVTVKPKPKGVEQ